MPPVSRIAGPIATVVALGLAVAFGWYRLIVQPTARATEFSESVQEAVRSHDLDLADRQVAEWLDDPNAPRPETGFFLKARIAVLRDRPAEAVDPLRRSLELGHDPEAVRRLDSAVRVLLGDVTGEQKGAVRRAFEEQRGPEPEISIALAHLAMGQFRLGEALRALDRWARTAPRDPRPWLSRARIGQQRGLAIEEVLADYQEARKRSDPPPEVDLGIAEQLLLLHRNAESEEYYRSYLQRNANDPDGWLGAARNALEMGKAPDAAEFLNEAQRLRPDHVPTLVVAASLDMQTGEPSSARTKLERAVELAPYSQEAQRALGQALARLGESDASRAAMATADQLRQDEEELTALRRALVKSPDNTGSAAKVARWMFAHGRDAEGRIWAEQVLSRDPDHSETHRLLAAYYDRSGNPGLANYHRLRAKDR